MCIDSPPGLRFAIRPILSPSLWKRAKKRRFWHVFYRDVFMINRLIAHFPHDYQLGDSQRPPKFNS